MLDIGVYTGASSLASALGSNIIIIIIIIVAIVVLVLVLVLVLVVLVVLVVLIVVVVDFFFLGQRRVLQLVVVIISNLKIKAPNQIFNK